MKKLDWDCESASASLFPSGTATATLFYGAALTTLQKHSGAKALETSDAYQHALFTNNSDSLVYAGTSVGSVKFWFRYASTLGSFLLWKLDHLTTYDAIEFGSKGTGEFEFLVYRNGGLWNNYARFTPASAPADTWIEVEVNWDFSRATQNLRVVFNGETFTSNVFTGIPAVDPATVAWQRFTVGNLSAGEPIGLWVDDISTFDTYETAEAVTVDYELTNNHSGISINFGGVAGTDYAVENFHHNKSITDRRVVYIKGATEITLSTNANNVRSYDAYAFGDGVVIGEAGGGVIRFRVDGDLHWGPTWIGGGANPAYSAPFSFADLSYSDSVPIVGTTGSNGEEITEKTAYFHYGHLDSAGDEWHVLQVAHDDSAVSGVGTTEFQASDGKLHHFVVNPKTPCVTVRTTGDAQFYTTPPKTYFIPKIHDQRTVFAERTGTVTFELRDINGNNVWYRIVADPDEAVTPYTDAGVNHITLNHEAFAVGTRYLQYYYTSGIANKKTREVIRIPSVVTAVDFPSHGETHGNLGALSDANFAAMLVRAADADGPYNYHHNRFRNGEGDAGYRQEYANRRFDGTRYVPRKAAENALMAKIYGISAVAPDTDTTYADEARDMLLENFSRLDSVGFEILWSGNAIPCREKIYRGYLDADQRYKMAYAYDILISIYRCDQHVDGLTPVEDYYLRDCLANEVIEGLMIIAGMYRNTVQFDSGEMWDTSRVLSAAACMLAVPSYSTPYYGTSGIEGSTTAYTHTPFISQALTWYDAFFGNATSLEGYPNRSRLFGLDGYLYHPETGHFLDRASYAPLVVTPAAQFLNLAKIHLPELSFPGAVEGIRKGTLGIQTGENGDIGPVQYYCLEMYNERFPTVADAGLVTVRDASSGADESDDEQINGHYLTALFWYDMDYVADPPPGGATGYTITGRTMGKVGAAYTYTLTLTPSGSVAEADVIFTPVATPDGTLSITTANIPAGSSSVAFQYTAATEGEKTISVTDNAGLTDPSAITFTASISSNIPGRGRLGLGLGLRL